MKRILNLPRLLVVCGLLFCTNTHAQYKQSIVNKTKILYNQSDLVPFKKLDTYKISVVAPSLTKYEPFLAQIERYGDINISDFSDFDKIVNSSNTIIFVTTSKDLTANLSAKIRQAIAKNKNVIVCKFQDSAGSKLQTSAQFSGKATELIYPEFSMDAQKNLAMSVFGGLAITNGTAKQQQIQTRLQYSEGVNSGLNIAKMTKKIDAIANEAIREKAAPGMVVMAVKNGQVIFEKSYGYHTYERTIPTRISDIFDLASVSKIAGTTPVIMQLAEKNIINLDSTIGTYLNDVRQTDKSNIKLRTVLLHEAGFTPFIPFYKELKKGDLQRTYSATHEVKVADSAFLVNDYYKNIMWPQMMNSTIKTAGKYVYSDISMYVMKEVAEHATGQHMDDFVNQNLYKPIGMKTAGYNPRNRYPKQKIVPTEHDTSFRKVLLEGYVHDQGAAMAGGLAGHAGLFATANDLAIYGQLLLNRGSYGGVQYFKPETVDLFTSNQSKVSRRGLGFDRFDPNPANEYPSKLANPSVYGHTGYTGTCIWIDPKNQLVYIFLSNRVHPQVSTKLLNLNIRSRIQDAIYETINEAK